MIQSQPPGDPVYDHFPGMIKTLLSEEILSKKSDTGVMDSGNSQNEREWLNILKPSKILFQVICLVFLPLLPEAV
ncbi:hypothetical protein Dpo_14c00590 [Desulfotignum phosphitoxidans DSM 13687]|jgi:hypothetical protein|uniref:Uncharacterized protein n=1 Tax=Desulfotignum phosphitoxidans DSM 13687 TaxID=1286635 RepID=S0FS87_9BACT|nr:hypothetical protein Dpo_14c00590 [Desulfotignum phosphitoxidans DSM 13687]